MCYISLHSQLMLAEWQHSHKATLVPQDSSTIKLQSQVPLCHPDGHLQSQLQELVASISAHCITGVCVKTVVCGKAGLTKKLV